ncbi:MAG: hypothetical protein ABI383_11375 [Acidobacteriaceae bacterium]
MIVIACALLLIGSLLYIFAPVAGLESGAAKSRVQYLYERREVIYENLRDLNFEFKAGKFPAEDYASLRASLEQEAAGVLAEIAKLEGMVPSPARET